MNNDRQRILFDARALQDANYSTRGIGHHSFSLLQFLAQGHIHQYEMIAICSPELPALSTSAARLFSQVAVSNSVRRRSCDIYICLSPLTHSPMDGLEELDAKKLALIYDFIPLEYPEACFPNSNDRTQYLLRLYELRKYDSFLCISKHTMVQLQTVLPAAAGCSFVTGVAVRPSLTATDQNSAAFAHTASQNVTILVTGGQDPRKNVMFALTTIRDIVSQKPSLSISVNVLGHYDQAARHALTACAQAGSGGPLFGLCIRGLIDDDAVADLYRDADFVIVPSIAEGFSMPVLEGAYFGCAVLASDISAHRELLGENAPGLFPLNSAEATFKVGSALADKNMSDKLRESQSGIAKKFTFHKVGGRFVDAIQANGNEVKGMVPRSGAPSLRVAFLTPVRPQASGISDYANAIVPHMAQLCDLTIATSALAPGVIVDAPKMTTIRSLALCVKGYDKFICAIGNSHYHKQALEFLKRHGGVAVVHDARMLDFYFWLYGPKKALELAREEGISDATSTHIENWLEQPSRMKTYFLSEVLAAADECVVHSRATRDLIQQKYGRTVHYLPFASLRSAPSKHSSYIEARTAARRELGLATATPQIAVFGIVSPEKCIQETIWASRLLHDWGIDHNLVFVGSGEVGYIQRLRSFVDELGLARDITFYDYAPDQRLYERHLLGADAGIQLRAHAFGSVSAALSDCMCFALPTVTLRNMAEAIEAPPLAVSVPDVFSPLHVAEAISEVLTTLAPIEERFDLSRAYKEAHSPDRYVASLMQIVGG